MNGGQMCAREDEPDYDRLRDLVEAVALGNTEYDRLTEIATELLAARSVGERGIVDRATATADATRALARLAEVVGDEDEDLHRMLDAFDEWAAQDGNDT